MGRLSNFLWVTTLIYGCSPVDSVIHKIDRNSQQTNTVLIGGHHGITEDDNIFRNNILPILAGKGYNHLALEIDSSLQPLAENLPCSIREIREKIKDFSYPDEITKTILLAHDLGFHLHFVDDFSLGYEGPAKLSERNTYINKNLESAILDNDPDAKIVAFFGASHVPTRPFFRPDAGTVFPLGYFLSEKRKQNPYVMVLLPDYKVEQFERFEGKDQALDIISLRD